MPPRVIAKDRWISPGTHSWLSDNKQCHCFMVVYYKRHYCAGTQKGKIISHDKYTGRDKFEFKPCESSSPQ